MGYEILMKQARDALKGAYAPYSKYKVGAAVLTKSGNVYTGCNIENAVFGLAVCAERVAVFKAVSECEIIDEIAIFSETGFSQPCGSCRQIFIEFNKNLKIYFLKDGRVVESCIDELLPDPFTAKSMEMG